MGLMWLLLWPLSLCAQVDYCYTFEDGYDNSRPMYWSALPNLDYHYVGVQSHTVHTGSKALQINGCTCYAIMPDEGINYSANGVWMTFWYYPHLNPDYLSVGYLTNPSDSTTFHLLATAHGWMQQWHFFAVDLSSVPTGARIAFFGHDIFAGDGTFFIDDIHLTSFPCAAWGLRVAENRADSVRFEWQCVGNALVHLDVGGYWYYMEVGDTSLTVPRNFGNAFSATLYLDGCQTSPCVQIPYSESVQVLRYREGSCPDITDYNSSMAVPYHGTYVDPYLLTGTYTNTSQGVSGIYAGSHTVNTNQGSEVTSGMMVFPRTIPPGDTRTLRLGNRLGDWETDAMLYTITVDTNEADLLVMKYTMAMAFGTFQGPDLAHHNDTLHPAWFSIELLDDTMAQLQPEGCNRFYIDMWNNTGWDEMNSMYRRRNFTGMAFDLSAYHGQRVRLRVTAADGVVNNRWCYGYYNIECLKRHDVASDCDGDSVELSVPYGFVYRWWREGDNNTISTNRTVTVPIDGGLYHCELTDRFNPACNYTVSRRVLAGTLLMVHDTVVENNLPHTFRGIVFNGAADTTFNVPAAVGCDTVVHYVLHVWPNQHTRVVRRVCPDEWPVEWEGHTFSGPDSIVVTLTDCHGADSTVTLVAVEAPTYEITATVVICPGSPFVYGGVDYGGPVAFDTLMTTVDGCDSLLHVNLVQRDSAFTLRAFHSVDLEQWADTVPIVLCSNQTLHVVDSTEGSAAWLWTLGDTSNVALRQAEFGFGRGDSVVETSIRLVVTSQAGCSDTLVWPVVVFPMPTADFIWDPARPVDMEPEVQLINYSQPESCSWLWTIETTDGDIDSLTDFSPFYRWRGTLPQGDVDVTLAASLTLQHDTITHTCTDTTTHTIQIVTSWLEFPNLVTPNGDGQNDRWEVVNLVDLGLYPLNEVWIFNQWGVQVFHACNVTRHEEFWDPNATSSPNGTYYFRFLGKSQYGIVRRNGVIEVLR